jgi:GDP/UDP-N,N'-diacetylbacillosamine 2-epimerase (hydrolysing)
MKRQILGITGIRSEYFLQRPIFQAISVHPELELRIVVTGAHHSPLHGSTANQVALDGFPVAANIDNLIVSDRAADRLKGLANQLQRLVEVVDTIQPDWLLAPADREEAMNMALCGAYLNLPVAHYAAGDRVIGNVDDMVRHAISRLSHLLLTTHEEARERLIRAGEQEWRVHNVGHSGLDRLRSTPQLNDAELAKGLSIEQVKRPYVIVIQHPLSSEINESGHQMEVTLQAVVESGLEVFISYPNSDPGSQKVIEAIEKYRNHPRIHIFENIPDVPFVNLLRGASALIGNSSLGLLEAPFLKLPVINVGRRQTARHHSENVFFAHHDAGQILQVLNELTRDSEFRRSVQACSNPFGDGHTGEHVAQLLAETPIDERLLNKDLSY